MKRLTKTQQYAILYMLDNGKTKEDIVHELKISLESLVRFIEKNQKVTTQENTIKTTSSKITSKDLMISQTSVKGNKSVSIMTKEASQVNDEFKKNLGSTVSRTARNAIHNPNAK